MKSFSLLSLGQGRKNGGGVQYHKERLKVLERVRLVAELSPEQRNDWDYFKENWDKAQGEAHGEDWAAVFAETMQHVLNELEAGRTNALSEFMHTETERVLLGALALQVPGAALKHTK